MSNGVLQLCLSRGWGGLEMYPTRIAPALTARGWRVYGAALEGTRVADKLKTHCIETFEFESTTQALWKIGALKRWIKTHDIAVLHCHKSSDLRLAALLKCLIPSLRVIFTEHMGVSRPKRDLYHRWAYSKVDQVLAISQATLERNRKALPVSESRLHLLYQGVDLSKHPAQLPYGQCQQLRKDLGLAEGDIAVAMAARITPGKGQRVFIEALGHLSRESRIKGIVIGGTSSSEGSNAEFVEDLRTRISELGLGDKVIFTGYRADLSELLVAMDIVCVPSRNEAFGLAAIEAMAASRPVIGSNSGALPEMLADGYGVLVDPEDAAAWAHSMQTLADDPQQRLQLGERGRQRVEAEFTLEHHMDGLERVYRGLPLI